jgi:alcohol dehydrogenase
MKAVIFHGINDLRFEKTIDPKIESPTDAIIKVTTSAICASDLHIKHEAGTELGTIMGHEYCGVIIETGNQVRNLKKGDRVAGRPVFSCGYCYYCRHQQQSICSNGGIFGGGPGSMKLGVQAEYAKIPFADNTLTKIPDVLQDEDVIFTGDILSTGFSGLLNTHVKLGDTIAVFGIGPVGLCAIACAPLFGAGLVVAIDLLDYRLDVARSYGALPINASREDPVSKILELTDGIGIDAGIEAAGSEASLKACLKSVRRGGAVSILGTVSKPFFFDLSERFFDMFNLNIGLGDQNHIEALIKLIKNGRLNLKPLITHTFPLAEAMTAYDVFERKQGNCIKVVLKNQE